MGVFLIFLFIFMIGLSIAEMHLKPKIYEDMVDLRLDSEKSCPPHQWEYQEGLPMTCKQCAMLAGQHKTDKGEY